MAHSTLADPSNRSPSSYPAQGARRDGAQASPASPASPPTEHYSPSRELALHGGDFAHWGTSGNIWRYFSEIWRVEGGEPWHPVERGRGTVRGPMMHRQPPAESCRAQCTSAARDERPPLVSSPWGPDLLLTPHQAGSQDPRLANWDSPCPQDFCQRCWGTRSLPLSEIKTLRPTKLGPSRLRMKTGRGTQNHEGENSEDLAGIRPCASPLQLWSYMSLQAPVL